MKVLVTGISGRIGANLAEALLSAGHEVRGLVWGRDARPDKLRGLGAELVEGDLREPTDVQRAVDGVEAICHLGAAFQGGGPFTAEDYFAINVRGTFNVLEAARQQAKGIQHLFFASTDAAYDKYVPGGMTAPIREGETAMLPRGWYALSKLLGEDMCLGYHRTYGLPVTVFRFAMTVAGEEILNYAQFRLSHWVNVYQRLQGDVAARVRGELQSLMSGGERLLIARDERGRSYKKHISDVRDVSHAFLAALGKARVAGETFQLGGPEPFTWEKAIPYLAQQLGMDYVDVRLVGHVPTFYEFDLSKSARLFGYQPQYDVFKMIDSAIAMRQGGNIGVIPTQVTRA